jgi:glycosyltransferase involved in cell wall biosynthesis
MPEVFAFVERLQARSIPYVVLCHLDHEYRLPGREVIERNGAVWSRAARVGFVARRSIELAERQLARRVPNAVVVRNPVNLDAPALLPWPSGDLVRFATVARLDAVAKGLDVLLETLSAARWRERSWRLRLCGDGPDRDFLQALVAFYDLGSHVELCGHVTDVAGIWADHHLLVLSSRAEGAPLALVEAMLCGRPAVATDVGGICEWIDDGETGFVAAAATRRALDAALESAWQARARWPEMGRKARDAAIARCDPDPGRTLLALLRDAARTRRGAVDPADPAA